MKIYLILEWVTACIRPFLMNNNHGDLMKLKFFLIEDMKQILEILEINKHFSKILMDCFIFLFLKK